MVFLQFENVSKYSARCFITNSLLQRNGSVNWKLRKLLRGEITVWVFISNYQDKLQTSPKFFNITFIEKVILL